MEFRVEEIARAAGVGVDTVRFYQTRGLLPPPERRGRVAIYSEAHLERLRRIRELNRQGVKLEAVGRVLDRSERADLHRSLLDALADAEGARTYTPAELSSETGVPEALLDQMRRAGLMTPGQVGGEARYTHSDLHSVRAALELLESGLPLDALLPLAARHAEHVRELTERAIELFDRHVRRKGSPDGEPSTDEVVSAFQRLLPAATALVALHFQNTLIERVRARLDQGADPALEAALAASEPDDWSPRLR